MPYYSQIFGTCITVGTNWEYPKVLTPLDIFLDVINVIINRAESGVKYMYNVTWYIHYMPLINVGC